MQKQKNRDTETPNRQSNMEQAEGSRRSVLSDEESFEHGAGTSELARGMGTSGKQSRKDADREGTGITNRGMDRERDEQQQLPERGKAKSEHD